MTTPGIFRDDRREHFQNHRTGFHKVHTISILVGNGFDIAALDRVGSQRKTTYAEFFDYLQSRYFDPSNRLYKMMDDLRLQHINATQAANKIPNWSDFETALQDHISQRTLEKDEERELDDDLEEIQVSFSNFLDDIVDTRATSDLGRLAKEKGWGLHTYSSFLADLSEPEYAKLEFPLRVDHYDIFSFVTLNFNFTSLLDNYLYLDKKYERHPFRSSDTNFQFHKNPRNFCTVDSSRPNSESGSSSYLLTNIFHPHGVQQVPRSLLFGVDEKTSSQTTFEKPFWAQHHRYYEDLIQNTDLFIIFGSSLGKTDRWWWKRILDRLHGGKSEAIIYKFCGSGVHDPEAVCNEVRKSFVRENSSLTSPSPASSADMENKIAVVPYSNPKTLTAFGFSPRPFEYGENLSEFYKTVDYPLPA